MELMQKKYCEEILILLSIHEHLEDVGECRICSLLESNGDVAQFANRLSHIWTNRMHLFCTDTTPD